MRRRTQKPSDATAPFYLEDGLHGRRLLPLGIGITDYLDILVDSAPIALVGKAIVEAFEEQCLAHRGEAYAYLNGFDPAFGFDSPGTALIGHAMRDAIARGATTFHFLRGQEPYKYNWGAKDRWNVVRRAALGDGSVRPGRAEPPSLAPKPA